ncbi:MAG: hypothetical protein RLZZ540_2239 [Bacteroidota bacterium]|jgi:hypothetical protein
MYTFYEIKLIYANCNSLSEVIIARDALDEEVIEGNIPEEKEQFIRWESIVRLRQIQALKPKR